VQPPCLLALHLFNLKKPHLCSRRSPARRTARPLHLPGSLAIASPPPTHHRTTPHHTTPAQQPPTHAPRLLPLYDRPRATPRTSQWKLSAMVSECSLLPSRVAVPNSPAHAAHFPTPWSLPDPPSIIHAHLAYPSQNTSMSIMHAAPPSPVLLTCHSRPSFLRSSRYPSAPAALHSLLSTSPHAQHHIQTLKEQAHYTAAEPVPRRTPPTCERSSASPLNSPLPCS